MKIVDALESLWKVNEVNAWEGSYGSFSEFCEDGLKIDKGTGSKYLAVYGHYVASGSCTVQQLRKVDIGKLYAAMKTGGTPELQYSRALTLTRKELRQEVTDPNDECKHEHQGNVCFDCHRRV